MISPRRSFRPEPAKPILYPSGTSLADIPPLARGLTEMEYLDHCITEWKKEPMPVPMPAASVIQPRTQRRSRR